MLINHPYCTHFKNTVKCIKQYEVQNDVWRFFIIIIITFSSLLFDFIINENSYSSDLKLFYFILF